MRVRAIVACQLFAATLASADAAAQVAKLYPVDEAARDPEFFAFRTRLIVAVQKHDTAFLYSVLSEHIRISFGSGGGAAAFKERWHPEDPESRLWDTLAEVLAFGGQFDESKTFCAPYWFAARLSAGDDPFVYGVTTAPASRNATDDGCSNCSSPAIEAALIRDLPPQTILLCRSLGILSFFLTT